MEVMHARLTRRRVAPALVEAASRPALHRFDDRLVLALNAIESRAGALLARTLVPYEREE